MLYAYINCSDGKQQLSLAIIQTIFLAMVNLWQIPFEAARKRQYLGYYGIQPAIVQEAIHNWTLHAGLQHYNITSKHDQKHPRHWSVETWDAKIHRSRRSIWRAKIIKHPFFIGSYQTLFFWWKQYRNREIPTKNGPWLPFEGLNHRQLGQV